MFKAGFDVGKAGELNHLLQTLTRQRGALPEGCENLPCFAEMRMLTVQ